MIDYELLGKRIKKARKQAGFTQEKLSEKLDISPEHFSRIECGKAKISLTRLAQLSDILGAKIEYLLAGSVVESSSYLKGELAAEISGLSARKLKALEQIIKILKDL